MYMETLLSTEIVVPLSQIFLALLAVTTALLIGRVRLALFVSYCFVLYWGKPWNLHIYTDTTPARLSGPDVLLMAFCFVTVLLAMMGLAFHRD
jgi:hypothetical protein